MGSQQFPKSKEYKSFLFSLQQKTGLDERPKFISKGRTRHNPSEFVVDDGSGTRDVIASCLQRPLSGSKTISVDVFGTEGRTGKLQLRRGADDSGYVFSGNLISMIINNENKEMELWGYPNERQGRGVFVLTVGVIR